jgi:hypothetical protein
VREVLLAVPELAASVQALQSDDLTAHVLAAIDDHVTKPWLRHRHSSQPNPGIDV